MTCFSENKNGKFLTYSELFGVLTDMLGSSQDKVISVNTVNDFLFLSKSTISLILTIGVTFAGQGFGGQAEQCSLVNLQRYGSSVIFSTEHGGNKLSQ